MSRLLPPGLRRGPGAEQRRQGSARLLTWRVPGSTTGPVAGRSLLLASTTSYVPQAHRRWAARTRRQAGRQRYPSIRRRVASCGGRGLGRSSTIWSPPSPRAMIHAALPMDDGTGATTDHSPGRLSTTPRPVLLCCALAPYSNGTSGRRRRRRSRSSQGEDRLLNRRPEADPGDSPSLPVPTRRLGIPCLAFRTREFSRKLGCICTWSSQRQLGMVGSRSFGRSTTEHVVELKEGPGSHCCYKISWQASDG